MSGRTGFGMGMVAAVGIGVLGGIAAPLLALEDAATPSSPSETTAARSHAEALELFKRSDFEGTEEVLVEALAAHPDDARLHHLLGMVYRNGRPARPDEAAREFAAALRLAPDLRGTAELLADALILSGKIGEAEQFLRERVKAYPDSAAALRQLGTLLLSDGRTAEATALLERSAELHPTSPVVWLEIGRARMQAGDGEGAVDALERARKFDPISPKVRYSLAQAYQIAGRSAEAETELQAYAELMATQDELQNRAQFLSRAQRSITLHEERLRLEPQAPVQLFVDLAALYCETGSQERGRAFFGEMAELRPAGLVGEALLQRDCGNPEVAWELLLQAQSRDPASPDTLGLLVNLAVTPARRDEVRSFLGAIEGTADAPVEIPLWRGLLALADGRFGEAEAAFKEALARQPDHPGVLRNLGVVYGMTGRSMRALQIFRQLTENTPEDGRAWFNLALTEARLGQTGPARDHLEQALAAGADEPQTFNLLARLVAQEGDRQQAIQLLERSLAVDPDQAEVRKFLASLRTSAPPPG